MILLANLKLQHNDALNDLLIGGFEKAIRMLLPPDSREKKNLRWTSLVLV